jgi:periplasmic divalent cation tolerance protein
MPVPDLSDAIVALTTLASAEAARELVRRLVEERVVACGTVIGSATSIYRWEGSIRQDDEALVVLKTRGRNWEALVAAVEAHHPYDVPELLALPVVAGHDRYLAWLTAETAGPEESQ